ncbi:Radical SAM domain protein [Desulfovibrio sp. X2]|uniref:radical SAM protein n=1 Tax=Desulfovibrio sp. X2 TaxID=941449 RepID=UPI000358DBF2|nr:radical SAM protein [Desulfovibrio sp. X2]EPR44716.1 Radical SAM domain protein [Desulfovibrio sp. X2]
MGVLERIVGRFRPRELRLDWAQIEVTTRCNAHCVYCPRTQAGTAWRNRDLDFGLFSRLLPQLSRTAHLHLQGWGEPLLHPHLLEMIRAAHAQGLRTGTTTNGVLLTPELAVELVRSGLDMLAVSLAGTGPAHDAARPGAGLDAALAAMDALVAARARLHFATPALHVAYMLLRGAEDELEALPRLLEGRGVSTVVVSTLDYVAAPDLTHLAFTDPGEIAAVRARLSRLAAALASRDVALVYRLPGRHEAAQCPENPTRALVVDAAGGVSPCVYTCIPAAPPHPAAALRLSFGSAEEEGLAAIWQRPGYAAFRAAWQARQTRDADGYGTKERKEAEQATQRPEDGQDKGPLPRPCDECAKRFVS